MAVHEFLDSSKAACADRRHRAVLHSDDLGLNLAMLAFPNREHIQTVVRQHILEDLGTVCGVAAWFARCDIHKLPQPVFRRWLQGREALVAMVVSRLPQPEIQAAHAAKVFDLLTLPGRYLPDAPTAANTLLMNSFGPALVRRLLGPPMEIESNESRIFVDHAALAEALIFTIYGRIPDLGDVARCFHSEPIFQGAAHDAV